MTTNPKFDVWFDGTLAAGTDSDAVCSELMAVFGIGQAQAMTLLNGKSHRIKKACDQLMANRLRDQFKAFGADLRLEALEAVAVPSDGLNIAPTGAMLLEGLDKPPAPAIPAPDWDLAPAGDKIPGIELMQDMPPINTDHLSLQSD